MFWCVAMEGMSVAMTLQMEIKWLNYWLMRKRMSVLLISHCSLYHWLLNIRMYVCTVCTVCMYICCFTYYLSTYVRTYVLSFIIIIVFIPVYSIKDVCLLIGDGKSSKAMVISGGDDGAVKIWKTSR